jgi:hypothetical protein
MLLGYAATSLGNLLPADNVGVSKSREQITSLSSKVELFNGHLGP